MGNKITFECDDEHKAYLPWFQKMEEENYPWVKSIILTPTGLPPIKVVEITPVYKEHRVKAEKYDFKIHRTNLERKDEKITIFFKKVVEKKKSNASAEFSGELADVVDHGTNLDTKQKQYEKKQETEVKTQKRQNEKNTTPNNEETEQILKDNMI